MKRLRAVRSRFRVNFGNGQVHDVATSSAGFVHIAQDEPARRLVRCLDLFDEIEALDPSPHDRADLVRACQVEPGSLREACLLRLRDRIVSRLVVPS